MAHENFENALTPYSLLAIAALTVGAAAVGAIVGVTRADRTAGARAGEAALMCLFGSILARFFIAVLLDFGDDQRQAGLIVGWLFFLVPGVVDSVYFIGSDLFGSGGADPVLTSPTVLLGFALVVGGGVGIANGAWRTYDFNRAGVPQFLADATWGLSGSMVACLLTTWNTIAGTRPGAGAPDDQRSGANRHPKGWHVPGHPDYAFTQGFTMSNLIFLPGDPLHKHERMHVTQNRLFGPLYTVSYLAWMLVLAIVAIPVALIRKKNVGGLVEAWAYLSNPWETWAYYVQRKAGPPPHSDVRTALSGGIEIPEKLVPILAVPWALIMLWTIASAMF
ncbi:MAG: hypothetical protein JWN20_2242 [Jatrophihabitantaceae bacterium]|nr:hypothetical protein [Jatrophihabitantaceae bacterium]